MQLRNMGRNSPDVYEKYTKNQRWARKDLFWGETTIVQWNSREDLMEKNFAMQFYLTKFLKDQPQYVNSKQQ